MADSSCACECRGNTNEDCGCKYKNMVYEVSSVCQAPNVCGVGALCDVVDDKPVCSCKSTGALNTQPDVRCCSKYYRNYEQNF